VQIIIQPKYENEVRRLIATGSTFDSTNDEGLRYSLLIGDLQFLSQQPGSSLTYSLLIAPEGSFSAQDLLGLNSQTPFQIISEKNLEKTKAAFEHISLQVLRQHKVHQVKIEIQKKRKELEKLNERLNQESQQQIVSLEQSHIEETQKNAKEKSLLHFLDFIQNDSVSEDFLNLLIRFLWKDLKRVGRLYQIGFSFRANSDKSHLYNYDGQNEHSHIVPLDFKSKNQTVALQMASLWGRPVGKVLTWSLPEFSRQGYFFIELIDQQISMGDLESYVKERLDVLSLYLDRWMIEKEYESVVDRWKRTFNSFSGYVHVIDEDYNIFQSNYAPAAMSVTHQKCYQVLAQRNSPCPECPINRNKVSEFLLRPGLRVKTFSSEFKYNKKKYFFVIYEDVTQMHLLKGQMIHSEKMAALGRLGNHLAHELNNPLTGIKSYVQSLLEDPQAQLSPTLRSDLSEILKASVRSQNIIRNFINFSHKSEPKLEKIVFAEVLQNALTLLKSVLRPHRLFVDVKPTQILANSHDLQQVLFNLIKNACQAMPNSGSLKIYEQETDSKVYFHIEDTGPGFSDEIVANIFEPFTTTKAQGEGTGLGLYLSKKLMQNMNAEIGVATLTHHGQKMGAKISLIFDKV
jgi:two-component system NtrC family sensor kinase